MAGPVPRQPDRQAPGLGAWVQLVCEVCGTEDYERPKKWWPTFDFVHCSHHSPAQLPKLEAGKTRVEYPDISARMYGIVDED